MKATMSQTSWILWVPRENGEGHRILKSYHPNNLDSADTLANAYPGAVLLPEGIEVRMLALVKQVAQSQDPGLRAEAEAILGLATPGGSARASGGEKTRPVDRQARALLNVVHGVEHEEHHKGVPVEHRVVNTVLQFVTGEDGFTVPRYRAMVLLADLMVACRLTGAAEFTPGIDIPCAPTRAPELLGRWATRSPLPRGAFCSRLTVDGTVREVAARLLITAGAATNVEDAKRAIDEWCSSQHF